MFDPANAPKPEMGFGGNDKSQGFQKDERFLTADHEKPGEWSLVGGDNFLCVLPSDSHVGDFIPGKPQDYKLGLPFLRVTVRPPGVKRMRNYKIMSKDNPLSKAYWRLYESIGKTPLWKEITAGFQAGGDNRRVLQVVTVKAGGKVSPVKMWSVTDTRGGETKEGQKPTMYEMVKASMNQIYAHYKQTTGQPMYPFMPNAAAVLKVTVLFQGEIPQFTVVPYLENGQPVLLDLTAQWGACDKDMAAKWIAEPDVLPDILTLETVMRSPQACQILGIAAAAPPMQQAAVAPPAQQMPFTPQGAPAMGFGGLQVQPAAPPGAIPAPGVPVGVPAAPPVTPPVVNPGVAAAPVVNPAGAAASAMQFSAGLQAEMARRAQGTPAGTPAGTPGKDEPPF